MKDDTGKHAIIAALLQTAVMAIASALVAPILLWTGSGASGAWYDIYLWCVYPLAGAAVAYKAVRMGVNAYLAWMPAPICLTLMHFLLLGYMPASFGMVGLAAFLALVGAATGDVRNRWKKRGT